MHLVIFWKIAHIYSRLFQTVNSSMRLIVVLFAFFFFNDTATTEIYSLSLHDALPIPAFGYAGRPVVRVRSLALHAGRCLGIYGPNGAGKTTLLRGMTDLLPPIEGSVKRPHELRIGYLAQHRDLQLQWPMSARDAALLALSARKTFGWVRGCRRQLDPWLKTLGVGGLAANRFATLSGGQDHR